VVAGAGGGAGYDLVQAAERPVPKRRDWLRRDRGDGDVGDLPVLDLEGTAKLAQAGDESADMLAAAVVGPGAGQVPELLVPGPREPVGRENLADRQVLPVGAADEGVVVGVGDADLPGRGRRCGGRGIRGGRWRLRMIR
jgi:hypothetical protein